MNVLKAKDRVYLDYNASTPPLHCLTEGLEEKLRHFANPSSTHQSAKELRSYLWKARENLARLIGCHPLELVFTSGGSESNNYAIKGLCEKFMNSKRKKIITSTVEHPSVSAVMDWAERKGFQVERIPVSREGVLDTAAFKKALDESCAFVSIMYVNNETGCVFPITSLAEAAREKGVLFHSDAVQALGKIPFQVGDLGVDLMSLSGHKFYAFKGCGVLYCKKGLEIESLILGGPQERKRRAGTENILSIAAFGEAARLGDKILSHQKEIKKLRDHLEKKIEKEISGVRIIGKKTLRVSNSSSILILDVFAETVMINLDLKGYSVSVSSACHSGSLSPSPVLLGMGYSPDEAGCVLRVSLGLGLEKKDMDSFFETLKSIVKRLRAMGSQ